MKSAMSGFTLIEVLVAIAVFSLSVFLIYGLIQSIRFNSSTMNTMEANQAIQGAFERTARTMPTSTASGGTYPVLVAADAPANLPGYTWSVSLCRANANSNNCTDTISFPQGSTYSHAMPTAVKLVRMTVTYTPNIAGRGSPVSAALEMARQ